MEDYIEINVAKDGRHFFATAPRSITHSRRRTTDGGTASFMRKALASTASLSMDITSTIPTRAHSGRGISLIG